MAFYVVDNATLKSENPPPPGTSPTVTTLCREQGFEPRARHTVDETSTLVTFVAAGLGLAVVPSPVSQLGVSGVTYRPLRILFPGVELCAAYRIDDQNPALSRALSTLRRMVHRPGGDREERSSRSVTPQSKNKVDRNDVTRTILLALRARRCDETKPIGSR